MFRINTLYQSASFWKVSHMFYYITFCPDCIPTVVHPENVELCESDALPVSMLSDAENRKRKFDQI